MERPIAGYTGLYECPMCGFDSVQFDLLSSIVPGLYVGTTILWTWPGTHHA
jgi:hypothetical protein